MVSVIIPVYNAEKWLEETVSSVLRSTYPHVEIILVNDGSTDDSQKIINRLVALYPDIKSFTQPNKSVSAARNAGIRNSTGKYILPLDADDLISPDYIEKAVHILDNDPDVKMVYGRAEKFGAKQGEWKLPDFDINLLARRNMVYVSGVFRRADFDKTGGYCETIAGIEDWDFWISLLKNGGKVVRIDSVCFYYRIIANSKRSQDFKKKKQVVDKLNERHKEFFERELGGKLHYQRSMSKFLNKLNRFFRLTD